MTDKKSRNLKVAGLITAMLACTGIMTYGVYSASTQTVATGGDASVVSYPHVDATINCVITPFSGDDAKTAINCDQVVVAEEDAKQTYALSDFGTKLASALHGNVETNQDDGRIAVINKATVAFTVANTSADYKLNYSITETDSNLVNMNATTVDDKDGDITVGGTSLTSTYTVSVTDIALSASGSFNWSIALTASK